MEQEKIKKLLEARRSKPGITERFMMDVREYLAIKFPNVLLSDIEEAATCIGQRFIVSANDMLMERDREWRRAYDRQKRYRVSIAEKEYNYRTREEKCKDDLH